MTMIRFLYLYTLLLFLICLSSMDLFAAEACGKVSSTDGVALANVAVTDGYTTVLSDIQGQYCITLSPLANFVYITLPAGFEVLTESNGGNFYVALSRHGPAVTYDFILKPIGDDSNHAFIVLGDPQVYNEADVANCAVFATDIEFYKDSLLQDIPVHGMVTGDMVGDRPDLFNAVKWALSKADMTLFFCKGNHDLKFGERSNEAASRTYETHFGPRYYAFNRGKIHYVVLDNVFYLGHADDYVGYINEEQFRWLDQDLKQVRKGSTVVLMLHIPTVGKAFRKVPVSQRFYNAAQLYEALAGYKLHVLSGHTHLQDHVQPEQDIWEHTQASISGVFWQENACADGTPVGYSIYRAEGDRLTWRYKALGESDSVQFRAYAVGENSDRPDELTVLVWNYDAAWRVCWYEDGVYAGEMQQFRGHDPKTRKEIIKNKGSYAYDWIWTTETDHLFCAKPLNTSSEIVVLVEDGFGNKFKTYVQQKKNR